jgi:uncharacterized phiE125 gp8 family phage protein
MHAPVRTAAPAATLVSLEEAKLHCSVDDEDTAQDALINGLIAAATEHLDGYTGILGRALVTQSWRQDYDGFESRLRLPLGPIASVSSLTYYDQDNTQQTLSVAAYELLTDGAGPYITLKSLQTWPGSYRRSAAVSVTFVAGVEPEAVPAPIKTAILLMVGHWFANREAVNVGNIVSELPMAVDALLRPYRRIGV